MNLQTLYYIVQYDLRSNLRAFNLKNYPVGAPLHLYPSVYPFIHLSIHLLDLTFTLISSGPPSVPSLSCLGLSQNVSGAVNVTVSWTLSGGDNADFYLINITTNAPHTPYEGLLNITNASVTQYQLTSFMADYEYNLTVRGVNCGSQEGGESEPLTITPQSKLLL